MAALHARHVEQSGEALIVGVCSRSSSGGKRVMEQAGRDLPVYTDFTRMIRELHPDVLIAAVPPHAHAGEVEQAAKAGIHLFLEKPIARSLERASSLTSAALDSGVVTQVDFHLRFTRVVQRLKGLLQQGDAGRPLLFSALYLCNSLHTFWWRDRRCGGGQVLEQAIHLYDLARYFLGEPVDVNARIANLCHRNIPDYTVEDNAVSAMVMDSGGLAAVASSNCAVPGVWNPSFTLVCEALTAQFSKKCGSSITWTADPEHQENFIQQEDPHKEALMQFFKAVRGLEEPVAPVTEGYLSLKLVSDVISQFTLN